MKPNSNPNPYPSQINQNLLTSLRLIENGSTPFSSFGNNDVIDDFLESSNYHHGLTNSNTLPGNNSQRLSNSYKVKGKGRRKQGCASPSASNIQSSYQTVIATSPPSSHSTILPVELATSKSLSKLDVDVKVDGLNNTTTSIAAQHTRDLARSNIDALDFFSNAQDDSTRNQSPSPSSPDDVNERQHHPRKNRSNPFATASASATATATAARNASPEFKNKTMPRRKAHGATNANVNAMFSRTMTKTTMTTMTTTAPDDDDYYSLRYHSHSLLPSPSPTAPTAHVPKLLKPQGVRLLLSQNSNNSQSNNHNGSGGSGSGGPYRDGNVKMRNQSSIAPKSTSPSTSTSIQFRQHDSILASSNSNSNSNLNVNVNTANKYTKELQTIKSQTRASHYNEVSTLTAIRKTLPLNFLIDRRKTRRDLIRRQTLLNFNLKRGDDVGSGSSFGSCGIHATDVDVDDDVDEDEDADADADEPIEVIDESEKELIKTALSRILRLYNAMLSAKLTHAFTRFVLRRDDRRMTDRNHAAKAIQKRARGVIAMSKVGRIRSCIHAFAGDGVTLVCKRVGDRRDMAIRIQCLRRILVAYAVIKVSRVRRDARLVIHRLIQLYMFTRNLRLKHQAHLHTIKCALTIQCSYRQHKARVISQSILRANTKMKYKRRFDQVETLIQANFERYAAAEVIQLWLFALPVFVKRRCRRLILNAAVRIQAWYRHLSSRVNLLNELACIRRGIDVRLHACGVIGRSARGRIARVKVGKRRKARVKRVQAMKRKTEVKMEFETLDIDIDAADADAENNGAEANEQSKSKSSSSPYTYTYTPLVVMQMQGCVTSLTSKLQNKLHKPDYSVSLTIKGRKLKLMQRNASIKIQCAARVYLSSKVLTVKRGEKRERSVKMLQNKFKRYKWRKNRWQATAIVQRVVALFRARRARRCELIVRVQSAYRGFMARKFTEVYRGEIVEAVVVIQSGVRGGLARKYVVEHANAMHVKQEIVDNGRTMYTNFTHRRETYVQIFNTSTKAHTTTSSNNSNNMSELHTLFERYCTMGTRNVTDRLGVTMFIKLCKDSSLITLTLTTQKLELIFTKVKGSNTHIKYGQLIEALEGVAKLVYPELATFGVSTGGQGGSKRNGNGSFEGDNAKFMKLLVAHILYSDTARRYIDEDLNSTLHATALATVKLSQHAYVIQGLYRTRVFNIDYSKRFLTQTSIEKESKKLKASETIQRFARCVKANAVMRKVAGNVYQKIYDDNYGGSMYYYNTKTGKSHWVKPKFLGGNGSDKGGKDGNANVNVIHLPDEVRKFSMACEYVDCGVSADYYDYDTSMHGGVYLCAVHHNEVHSNEVHSNSNSRVRNKLTISNTTDNALALVVKLEKCVNCNFQLATKSCLNCNSDIYCDTCYFTQHLRGALSKHAYAALSKHCDVCSKFVALLNVGFYDGSDSRAVCKVCYSLEYPWDEDYTQDDEGGTGVRVTPYVHVPRAVVKHKSNVLETTKIKAMEEDHVRRKSEDYVRSREHSARLVQRVYRGYHVRFECRFLIANRQAMRVQRKLDGRKRKAFVYQMKLLLGVAEELRSDTLKEKVLKRFPIWYEVLVTDVVVAGAGWEEAYGLIKEQEEFVGGLEKIGTKRRMIESWSFNVMNAKKLVAVQHIKYLEANKNKAQVKYRTALTEMNFPESEKEELKLKMRTASNNNKKAIERFDLLTLAISTHLQKTTLRKGPRAFSLRLKSVRKHGRLLHANGVPVTWKLKTRHRYVEPTSPSTFNVFKAKLLKPGARLLLGDVTVNGTGRRFYRVVGNDLPPSIFARVIEEGERRLDPDGFNKRTEIKRIERENWNTARVRVDKEWVTFFGLGLGGDANASERETSTSTSSVSKEYLHVMPREIFVVRCKNSLVEFVGGNVVSQGVRKKVYYMLGKVDELTLKASTILDDDSKDYARLLHFSDRVRRARENVAKHSNVCFIPDPDVIKAPSTLKPRLIKLKNFLVQTSVTAFKAVFNKDSNGKVDHFKRWDASSEKVDVVVTWSHNLRDIVFGTIKMDLDAPSTIAREYIRRCLREPLNVRVGENFKFVTQGDKVEVAMEEGKRIGQIAPQKLNSLTREVEYTLVLCADDNEFLEKRKIPVIVSDKNIQEQIKRDKAMLESLLLDEFENLFGINLPDGDKITLQNTMGNCGVSEKKIKSCFNKEGFLMPEGYNDVTRNLLTDNRVVLKKLLDSVMGVDTVVSADKAQSGGDDDDEDGEAFTLNPESLQLLDDEIKLYDNRESSGRSSNFSGRGAVGRRGSGAGGKGDKKSKSIKAGSIKEEE